MAARFPSMKARDLLAILQREPLGYVVTRSSGSHRVLEADGRPRLIFAFHDRVTIAPGLVRRILTVGVALSEDEALELL